MALRLSYLRRNGKLIRGNIVKEEGKKIAQILKTHGYTFDIATSIYYTGYTKWKKIEYENIIYKNNEDINFNILTKQKIRELAEVLKSKGFGKKGIVEECDSDGIYAIDIATDNGINFEKLREYFVEQFETNEEN